MELPNEDMISCLMEQKMFMKLKSEDRDIMFSAMSSASLV